MATPQHPEPGDHVPEDNRPGHHPDHEQDKPDVRVAAVPRGVRGADAQSDPDATVAGDALRAAAGVVRKAREALPGD